MSNKNLAPLSDNIAPAEVYISKQTAESIVHNQHYFNAKPVSPPELSDPSRTPPPVTFLPKKGAFFQSVLVRVALALVAGVGLVAVLLIANHTEVQSLPSTHMIVFATLLLITPQAIMFNTWALERVFKKAGIPPYGAWIPLYNIATLYKISGMNPNWAWLHLAPSPSRDNLYSRLDFFGFLRLILTPVLVIISLVRLIVSLKSFAELSIRFGKPTPFMILILLGVGIPILGFGRATYNKNTSWSDWYILFLFAIRICLYTALSSIVYRNVPRIQV